MIGRSRSTEIPQPVVVTSVFALGSKAGTAKRRTVPETPRAIASSALLAPPSVCHALRQGRFSFTPAWPSGRPPARSGGRRAARASSRPTSGESSRLFETRTCAVRL